jgi:hypothetical protein
MSRQLDVRGPRFVAAITAVVVALVLITGNAWLALAQTLVFAVGAVNIFAHPYALLYRRLVAPRLHRPSATEPPEPVRFAQGIGFVFLSLATVSYFAGATVLGTVMTGFALAAAFLNAAFGVCLGCELYLLIRRVGARAS